MSEMPGIGGPLGAFRRVMDLVDRVLWRVEQGAIVVSCAALFGIMVLIFLDATLRYALNRPLVFTFDVVTMYLISAAVMLVLSYTLRRGGHVSVELFADMLPRRAYHVLLGLGLLGAAVVLCIMAERTTVLSVESWVRNELTVGLHALPVWPSKGLVALSLVLVTLRTVHAGLTSIAAGLTGRPDLAFRISSLSEGLDGEGVR